MARWNELEWRDEVYAAAEVWRNRCFFADSSLFSPDKNVWTEANFRSLDKLVVQRPLYRLQTASSHRQNSDTRQFILKLEQQLSGKTDDNVIQLAAELFWFINLISTKGIAKKREYIHRICSWRSLEGEEEVSFLNENVLRGIANPGPQFSRYIFVYFVYMISMMIEWKATTVAFRNRFRSADKSWSFADWWDQKWAEKYQGLRHHQSLRPRDVQQNPQIRHCLMFFLYTHSFERVVSWQHKKRVIRDLLCVLNRTEIERYLENDGLNSFVATDRIIFVIRKKLAVTHGDNIDFYEDPIDKIWDWKNPASFSNRRIVHLRNNLDCFDDNTKSFDETAAENQAVTDPMLEGKPKLTKHYYRERDPTLRRRKLAHMIDNSDGLSCECCNDKAARYRERAKRVFEIHHKIPLASYDGGRITQLHEVAVLCANCHRVIHATNPPRTVEDLRAELAR